MYYLVPENPILSVLFVVALGIGTPSWIRTTCLPSRCEGAGRNNKGDGQSINPELSSGNARRCLVGKCLGVSLALVLSTAALLKGNSLFAWHVIGMSFGAFVFQAAGYNAILAKNWTFDFSQRQALVTDHRNLMIASSLAMIVGFSTIYLNKAVGFPGKHFTSVHSWFGSAALTAMICSFTNGLYQQGSPMRPVKIWVSSVHRKFGKTSFLLVSLSAVSGLYNRTVILDWQATPIKLAIPDGWHKMGGWAMGTGGPVFVSVTIICVLALLAIYLPLSFLSPRSSVKRAVA